MKEDYTKIEVEKYCLENGKDRADGEMAVGGAGFTLYPAKLDDTAVFAMRKGGRCTRNLCRWRIG